VIPRTRGRFQVLRQSAEWREYDMLYLIKTSDDNGFWAKGGGLGQKGRGAVRRMVEKDKRIYSGIRRGKFWVGMDGRGGKKSPVLRVQIKGLACHKGPSESIHNKREGVLRNPMRQG